MQLLRAKWAEGKFVCVGLDSDYGRLPESMKCGLEHSDITDFNRRIVNATNDLVCAYKLNAAFYEAIGPGGYSALAGTISHIPPYVPVILDAKRADIGNTNVGYAQAAFNHLGVDAITVHPYLGREALRPFLDHKNKGIIVLCRTSNKGAGEFQDLLVGNESGIGGVVGETLPPERIPLYQNVADSVARHWNKNGNCALVVGATYPTQLAEVRKIVGDMPILIPGIGAQGGDLEKTVAAGKDNKGQGMIINSSRNIIFASSGEDFAEAARRETQKLHDAITNCLQQQKGKTV